MHIHGIVMAATLEEDPADPERVEMQIVAQGVGPGHPRRIVVPMELLVANPEIEPELIAGHSFEAEVHEVGAKRWVAESIGFAARRVLRPEP